MTKDEALHKALKVLNCLNNDRVYETAWVKGAINACEEVLEQPAQEPVYQVYSDECCKIWEDCDKEIYDEAINPYRRILYTHPHQWQGLTDDEIGEMYDEAWMKYKGTKEAAYHLTTGFARAIEQALKDKNT